MIPRQYRLKHDKDFEVLFKEGKFIRGTYVGAKVWKIDPDKYERRGYTDDTLRIGFVVSKKVEKRAVRRNKIKRQMREAARLELKFVEPNHGYLLAFIATPASVEATYADIAADVQHILRRAHIV